MSIYFILFLFLLCIIVFIIIFQSHSYNELEETYENKNSDDIKEENNFSMGGEDSWWGDSGGD